MAEPAIYVPLFRADSLAGLALASVTLALAGDGPASALPLWTAVAHNAASAKA